MSSFFEKHDYIYEENKNMMELNVFTCDPLCPMLRFSSLTPSLL